MSAYEYTPITAPQEIRLLILLPGSRGEAVKVGLEHVNSNEHSKFEALSYVWGDGTERSKVIVQQRLNKSSSLSIPANTAEWSFERELTDTFNSRDWQDVGGVLITKNLAIVLDYLRYEDKPRILWVDAVCINQENLDEKEQQVKRMGSNYENAQRTIVWLGPDAKDINEKGEFDNKLFSDIDFSFDMFRESYAKRLNADRGINDERTTSWVTRGESPMSALTPIFKPLLKLDVESSIAQVERFIQENDAARALLRRPWWYRIWIVQETSKSRAIDVYFGGQIIDWKILCGGAEEYLSLHWKQVALPESSTYQLRALFEAQRLKASHPNGKNLLSLLHRYRWFEATNPRDKVYGILGLARKGLGDPGIPKVDPNYKIDTFICYRDVTLEIMRASGNLDILQLCPRPVCLPTLNSQTHDSQRLSLPSWIPDFSYDIKQLPEQTVVEDMGPMTLHAQLESTEGSGLTASGNSQCRVELRPDGRTLTVQGFMFDSIVEQSDKLQAVVINTQERVGFGFEALRHFFCWPRRRSSNPIPKIANYEGEEHDWETIFYRTMVKGDLGTNAEETIAGLKNALKHTLKRRRGLGRLPGTIGGLVSSLLSINTSNTFPVGYIYNQRLVKTSKGYLGLVPHDAEIGDEVALLAGGKSPFLVRGNGDGQWKLVGDCYIEGLMHGEDISSAADRDSKSVVCRMGTVNQRMCEALVAAPVSDAKAQAERITKAMNVLVAYYRVVESPINKLLSSALRGRGEFENAMSVSQKPSPWNRTTVTMRLCGDYCGPDLLNCHFTKIKLQSSEAKDVV
ncbi:hypothetical protein CIB48_g3122 [Xylaria polymorpha]|nr:hypothetical protein CIB48_g3122 [Xylaria polymorpha]